MSAKETTRREAPERCRGLHPKARGMHIAKIDFVLVVVDMHGGERSERESRRFVRRRPPHLKKERRKVGC
jgi:hypothetical protein